MSTMWVAIHDDSAHVGHVHNANNGAQRAVDLTFVL